MPPRMQVAAPVNTEGEDQDQGDSKKAGMSDDDLLALLRSEIANSTGGLTTNTLSENRKNALKTYMGDPYGDEMDGQSRVVTTEFRDTVESLLPQLVKIFMASDTVVQFEPDQPQDDEGSAQATEYINHVFMVDNKGFLILYTMIKDALMFKNGIVKCYWDETQKVTTETYRGLTVSQRDAILSGENVEPIEYSHYSAAMPGALQPDGTFAPGQPEDTCDLKIKRVDKIGRAKVVPVPPEEFMISRRTASIQSATFCGQRTPKTVSELIEMGVPRDKAEGLVGSQGEGEFSIERAQRFFYDGDTNPTPDTQSKSARQIWVYECFLLVDMDGDGIAEKWKFTLGGDQYTLLFREEHEGPWPFESISPILMPHKFYGLSIYDLVQQWQRIMTTLMRQFLNNIYNINNNRIAVNADRANLDDLLTNRPNQLVRTLGNPNEVIMPMVPQSIGGVIIPAMQEFQSMREKATGVTSYNQGLDADSLNKTASGISQIMGAAQERILLIARIFADTGICGIFQQLLFLTCKHQDKARVVRLRGKWVNIDPAAWNAGMNAITDVALGTNNRDQMLLHLNQVLAIQQQAMSMPNATLVTPKNIYNTLKKLVENAGLKHVESYFTDPDSVAPPPPQPNPDEAKAQADLKKSQMGHMASQQEQQAQLEAQAREKMVSVQTDFAKMKNEMADAEKERQLKLRIARELNITNMLIGEGKNAASGTAAAMKPQPSTSGDKQEPAAPAPKPTSGKPLAFNIGRDTEGRMSTIVPIYEQIKEEADPEDAP